MTDPILKAQAVERLLGDAVIQEVLADIDAEYTRQLKTEPALPARELAYHGLRGLNDLLFRLRRIRDAGTRALASNR